MVFFDFFYMVKIVSLFTREWIEMSDNNAFYSIDKCLPLYEGVD